MSRIKLLEKLAAGPMDEAVAVWEETEDDNEARAIDAMGVKTWGQEWMKAVGLG